MAASFVCESAGPKPPGCDHVGRPIINSIYLEFVRSSLSRAKVAGG